MSTLSDNEFREHVESGKLAVDSHYLLLRIANMYLTPGTVFSAVDDLHSHGWSFGNGILRFNRTLDTFYLAQLGTGLSRANDYWGDEEFEDIYADKFDAFYTEYHDLLHENVWKEFYTPSFLAQPSSARFWRLPNLRDRTDTSDPWGVRRKGTGQFTKLPRWAVLVTQTHWRQPTLSKAMIKQLALSTLQETMSRQRNDCPGDKPQPYSETQAHFWLNNMGIERNPSRLYKELWDLRFLFGSRITQGYYDVRKWEAYYSKERWESVQAQTQVMEPDLDGTRKSEIRYSGLVEDAGMIGMACELGWEEELGSEEEIMFLAAVAAKEVETIVKEEAGAAAAEKGADIIDGVTLTGLNYAMRSHMILGVLRAAFETNQTDRARHIEDLKRQFVTAGRFGEMDVEPAQAVDSWVKLVLEIVEPYAADKTRPVDVLGWSELLRLILEENGQLFGRWMCMGETKNPFLLGPRMDLVSPR
ncbi:hypothetical protein F5X68DRAFT_275835 [Plectosphaerella plurivora]|uniref:Uncharacterized protein n=1 Tax=Plectosphaerella plurivora TaxID=936078 RepID=A0A9P8VC36_9PEZI|nr:hypothetical protein F5X68DRAFT_275835 [Plectosphaerella plurivora]